MKKTILILGIVFLALISFASALSEPINCTQIDDLTPIKLDFTIDGNQKIIWTFCSGTGMSLNYTGINSFEVYNDTSQIPMEIERGTGTEYNYHVIWSSYSIVYHMDDLNSSAIYESSQNETGIKEGVDQPIQTEFDDTIGYSQLFNDNNIESPNTDLDVTDVYLSIEAIVNETDNGMIVDKRDSTSDGFGFALVGNYIYLKLNAQETTSTGTDIIDGSFHYIGATYDDVNVRLWVDGSIDDTKNAISNEDTSTTENLDLGAVSYGGTYYFDGVMEEVRVSETNRTAKYWEDVYNNWIGTTGYGTMDNTTLLTATIENNITIYYPTNESTFNISDHNFTVNYNYSGDSATLDCNLSIFNDTSLLVAFVNASVNKGQNITNYFSFVDYNHYYGNLTLVVNCTDTTDLHFDSGEYTVMIYDDIAPVCSNMGNEIQRVNTTFVFSSTCTDENFFSINMSCDNGFSNYTNNINLGSYLFNDSFFLNVTTNCTFEYCDGHTDNELGFYSIEQLKEDKIEITFDGINKNTIYTLDNSVITTYAEKDRINFDVSFPKMMLADKEIYYQTSENSYYIPSNQYKAWIVDVTSKTWFDLNEVGSNYDYRVDYLGEGLYKVTLFTSKTDFSFSSVGKINCVSGTKTITAEPMFNLLLLDFNFTDINLYNITVDMQFNDGCNLSLVSGSFDYNQNLLDRYTVNILPLTAETNYGLYFNCTLHNDSDVFREYSYNYSTVSFSALEYDLEVQKFNLTLSIVIIALLIVIFIVGMIFFAPIGFLAGIGFMIYSFAPYFSDWYLRILLIFVGLFMILSSTAKFLWGE